VAPPSVGPQADQSPHDDELVALYHRLNNQLGIVLANAELLESKAADTPIASVRPNSLRVRSRPWRSSATFVKE
jgi:hypothetical protein